jgi:hypothetical protein
MAKKVAKSSKMVLFVVEKSTGKETVVAIFSTVGDASLAVKLFNESLSESSKERLKYIAR